MGKLLRQQAPYGDPNDPTAAAAGSSGSWFAYWKSGWCSGSGQQTDEKPYDFGESSFAGGFLPLLGLRSLDGVVCRLGRSGSGQAPEEKPYDSGGFASLGLQISELSRVYEGVRSGSGQPNQEKPYDFGESRFGV